MNVAPAAPLTEPGDPAVGSSRRVFAIVVGSGLSGLGVAIALKKEGIDDLVILERGDAVGGTWRDNVYPGCACDIPSHLYSYSFELNPRWSKTYAPQPEIRAYVEHCTDKYDLRRHVRTGSEVTACTFDEAAGEWTVDVVTRPVDGPPVRVRYVGTVLVLALGGLSKPSIANIPGKESFAGPSFHSAEWRTDVDLRGKRIGVIGTGASAIQFVPKIAPLASHLTLFQRTPPWVLPRRERDFTEKEKRAFERVPGLMRAYRSSLYALHEATLAAFIGDPRLFRPVQSAARSHLSSSIADKALRAKLTPTYTMGCKRILTSNDYYPALARPNVSVETTAIQAIDEAGVATADGVHHACDVLIYGTGFAVHDYLGGLPVKGLSGVDIHAAWTRGAEAYLGTSVAGFPNCFALLGPNVALGHNSIIVMIEAQVKHIVDVVRELRRTGAKWIEVRESVMRRFNDALHRRFAGSVWATGCASWYLDEHGKNTTIWPATTAEFWMRTRRFQPADYRLSSEVGVRQARDASDGAPHTPHDGTTGASA